MPKSLHRWLPMIIAYPLGSVEHIVSYVHTQDGLAGRTLVMRTKLLVFASGYAILHATMSVRLRPTATHLTLCYSW